MMRERRLKALEGRMMPPPTPKPMRVLDHIIDPDGTLVAITAATTTNRPRAETEAEQ